MRRNNSFTITGGPFIWGNDGEFLLTSLEPWRFGNMCNALTSSPAPAPAPAPPLQGVVWLVERFGNRSELRGTEISEDFGKDREELLGWLPR